MPEANCGSKVSECSPSTKTSDAHRVIVLHVSIDGAKIDIPRRMNKLCPQYESSSSSRV